LLITNDGTIKVPSGCVFSVNGTSYGGGTNFMRLIGSSNNAAVLNLSASYTNMSLGCFFRWGGAYVDFQPRPIIFVRDSAYYQSVALNDGSPDGASYPNFEAHWLPGGTGVGTTIAMVRNQWYWVTMSHVGTSGTTSVKFYDPYKNFALVGTSTGTVSTGSAATQIQLGCTEFSTKSTQWYDFADVIVDTNAVFPLKPF
jgi:hypothetical protein